MTLSTGPGDRIKSLAALRRLLCRASHVSSLVGMYGLLASAFLVSLDVVLRKIFSFSFVGADEISGYALAVAVSWGAAYSLHKGSMIRVDVIHRLLPVALKSWLDILALAANVTFGSVLAYYALILGLESLEFGAVANTPLRVPLWIPQLLWTGGLGLMVVSAIVMLLEAFLRACAGDHQTVVNMTAHVESGDNKRAPC